MPEGRIQVLGVHGDRVPDVGDVDLTVGAARYVAAGEGRHLVVGTDIPAVLDAIEAEPGRVCVLASGDPGFFGIVRALAERFGPDALDVQPAPSSVAVAFARLGLPWDDAVVASAHGRPLADAARAVATAPKAAVLTAPDAPPESLAKELLALGVEPGRPVAVCTRLGEHDERVDRLDLAGLAAGTWHPRSVVVLLPAAVAASPTLAWGRPEAAFLHRGGMVTKAEVRAVILGKLALPATGVLWDVGAGSASVAVESAALAPGLRVVAVERDPASAARARANAAAHGVAVEVVEGEAPAALAGLPDPDRAFVGGGGLDVLDEVIARLRPGGQVVAAFAALDRAAAAFDRLGHLVEMCVSRGEALPGGGVRLAAQNPVFVAWGPGE